MNVLGKILKTFEDILHFLGCLGLVTVVVLINADILLRLFFKTPVQFQFEFTELYLMPALATLSLSRVFREGGHLALDFMPEHLPGLTGAVIARLRLLLPAAFFAAVTVMSGIFAFHAFAGKDVEYGVYDWPLGWAYAVVPLGCGVLVLRLLYDACSARAPEPMQV
ncbi:TRAP transporter small permease [Martelella mediterranea]|uniref:TRAP transporter small permease protein n=1 Tax=Martelella mediterranea DSM 17316 TaxID=1122214 RepID=A0A1U9YWR5_9HYPH|nr:TRAP transporter small permease [Martelella mediterranea]AQZ49883.1 TRAP-type C4-dicarboxylate transport system, small permease component [Martelella mediterranea DSM 17316]